MYDVPQNVLRPVLSSDAGPYVPAVSEGLLAVWASAGKAAVGSEPPYLVAGIIEAASSVFEHVATDFSQVGITARPPQPIKRKIVMPRCVDEKRRGNTACSHVLREK